MTEQIQQPKEPTTLEEVKAVMEEHGAEKIPKPEPKESARIVDAPKRVDTAPAAETKTAETIKTEEKKSVNPAAAAPPGYVPVEALRETRRESKRQFELLQGTLNEIKAGREAVQPKTADAEPDIKSDPDGWYQWKIAKQDAELRSFREEFLQTKQQTEQQQQVQRVVATASAQEAGFAAQKTDYFDSLRFLEQQRDQFYQTQGMDDPQERQKYILRDKYIVSKQAVDMGISAAAHLYGLAIANGYQPSAADPAKAAQPAQTGTVDTDPALKAVKNGQSAAGTLSKSGSGASVSDEVTMETLANLKGAAFDSALKKFRQQHGLE